MSAVPRYGGHGGVPDPVDPALHLEPSDLDALLGGRPPAPRNHGRVVLIVARGADAARTTPEFVHLSVGEPVPEDRWDPLPDPEMHAQISPIGVPAHDDGVEALKDTGDEPRAPCERHAPRLDPRERFSSSGSGAPTRARSTRQQQR